MKRKAIAAAIWMTLSAPSVYAGGGTFGDYAKVTGVDPQYERVNVPQKDCYTEILPERRYHRDSHGLIGPLIGGVAGGLIGSSVGEGNGKVAASAAGAAIGAIVGDRLQDRRHAGWDYGGREVERCRVVDRWESRLTGYHVTYDYRGRSYTTFLPYDPGPRLPVTVSVEPAVDGSRGWER